MSKDKISILFVCLGNICRSPTAEGIFRHMLSEMNISDNFELDSAGTHAYHVGAAPDSRAQATAVAHGVDLSDLKGRKVEVSDFDKFDFVLAMDKDNYSNLKEMCPPERYQNLSLFLDFAKELDIDEVPDPYYGGTGGFDKVFDMLEQASLGLIEYIKNKNA